LRQGGEERRTGHSRGEDAVADDHGRPEQSEHEQQPLQLPALLQRRAHARRQRRQRAAVALLLELVVGSATVADDAREEPRTDPAADEGVEREGTALAVVVGAQDDEHVLEERDEGERPEHEREHPIDLLVALGVVDVAAGEGALVHVERRRRHLAVHHAEALVRQHQLRPPRLQPHPTKKKKKLPSITMPLEPPNKKNKKQKEIESFRRGIRPRERRPTGRGHSPSCAHSRRRGRSLHPFAPPHAAAQGAAFPAPMHAALPN